MSARTDAEPRCPAMLFAGVLLLFLFTGRAYGASLLLKVVTDRDVYSIEEEVRVTITLKNISGGTIVLPKIDGLSQRTYIRLEVFHESGAPVFFVDFVFDAGSGRADNTQELQHGEELVFKELLNQGGLAPMGFADQKDPSSLQFFSGQFGVAATFSVGEDTLPTAGNAAVFRGTVTSAPYFFVMMAKQVKIDIQPGSTSNFIDPRSRENISVAILSTDSLDAPKELDKASLTFGRTGDEASLAFCSEEASDVNGDGLQDVVCQFKNQATGFQYGATEGILRGEITAGVPIEGRESLGMSDTF